MKIKIGSKELDLTRPVGRVGVVDLICPRRGWHAYNEPVVDMVRGVDELMFAGSVYHEVLLNQLKEQGCDIEVKIEVEVCGKRRRFRADAVCDNTVVELKRRYTKELAPIYLWQLKVYMALLGYNNGAIVSLSDGYVKEVVADQLELGYVKSLFMNHLEKAICSSNAPERHIGKWCKYCKWNKQCLNNRLV